MPCIKLLIFFCVFSIISLYVFLFIGNFWKFSIEFFFYFHLFCFICHCFKVLTLIFLLILLFISYFVYYTKVCLFPRKCLKSKKSSTCLAKNLLILNLIGFNSTCIFLPICSFCLLQIYLRSCSFFEIVGNLILYFFFELLNHWIWCASVLVNICWILLLLFNQIRIIICFFFVGLFSLVFGVRNIVTK